MINLSNKKITNVDWKVKEITSHAQCHTDGWDEEGFGNKNFQYSPH